MLVLREVQRHFARMLVIVSRPLAPNSERQFYVLRTHVKVYERKMAGRAAIGL